jgi:hypothetical protein
MHEKVKDPISWKEIKKPKRDSICVGLKPFGIAYLPNNLKIHEGYRKMEKER